MSVSMGTTAEKNDKESSSAGITDTALPIFSHQKRIFFTKQKENAPNSVKSSLENGQEWFDTS